MTPAPVEPEPTARQRRDDRTWIPLGAFAFVIVALIALAITPAVLLQRTSRTAEETRTTILPAYDALRDLAFAMEARIAASRSLWLTGNPEYRARLVRARAAEDEALRTVHQLAPRLDPSAAAHVRSLDAVMARRDSLESALIRSGAGVEAYRAQIPRFNALRDSMLVQVGGIRRDLMDATEARAAAGARIAGLQRLLSILLGATALAAAAVVGWFAWRQRRLRRRLERALAEANLQRAIAERRGDALARATESRVRLIRGITHDVKNPLGAARGYAELLELGVRAPVAPEQKPLIEGVKRSVEGALSIIGDLLDLARADSGGLPIKRVPIDLRDVVRETTDDHRSAAEAAGHSIDLELPPDPLRLESDPTRVAQVLGNLLSNAIKYSPPPGRIIVRATSDRTAAPGDRAWARVHVSDSGPGIPPDQQEAVFDEFTRLEDDGSQEGHGLGLAIARRIARLLDGDLAVDDAPGDGATFVLSLPLDRRARASGDPQ